ACTTQPTPSRTPTAASTDCSPACGGSATRSDHRTTRTAREDDLPVSAVDDLHAALLAAEAQLDEHATAARRGHQVAMELLDRLAAVIESTGGGGGREESNGIRLAADRFLSIAASLHAARESIAAYRSRARSHL